MLGKRPFDRLLFDRLPSGRCPFDTFQSGMSPMGMCLFDRRAIGSRTLRWS